MHDISHFFWYDVSFVWYKSCCLARQGKAKIFRWRSVLDLIYKQSLEAGPEIQNYKGRSLWIRLFIMD